MFFVQAVFTQEGAPSGKDVEQLPLTMVWVVLDSVDGQQIISSDSNAEITKLVSEVSHEKGIPLILPLMDLQDMSAIALEDVVHKNLPLIENASKRYNASNLLIGKLTQTKTDENTDMLHAVWTLKNGNMTWDYQTEGDGFDKVFRAGLLQALNSITHQRSAKKAETSSAPQMQFSLAITDVKTIDNYIHLVNYLKTLPLVVNVDVKTVGEDYVVFDLVLQGTQDEFAKTVDHDHILALSTAENNSYDGESTLNYQLVS